MQNNAVLAPDQQQGHDGNNIGLDLSKLQHHHVEGIMLVCATLELTLMMLADIADQIFRSIRTFPPYYNNIFSLAFAAEYYIPHHNVVGNVLTTIRMIAH
ncbi:hypothetical protein INT45_001616 [Circinella minor]|uniref:Uncharacterized protein n=1 Tax=Circinella minor TaxID=1195481 RepID=A0A8H7RSQ1_9FUNG|nr:hypothetical protein INT45_001616 [Circinella minor]